MPLPRFERLPADKRDQLLAVAASEFAALGYEGASLNEILAKAGLGKSSYYYYFADKEDLYITCIEDAFTRLIRKLPPLDVQALTAKTFWPAIERYFLSFISLTASEPVNMALFRGIPAMRRVLANRYQAIMTKVATPFSALVNKGRELGCVRTDLSTERLLAVGMAADNALDETFLAQPGEITPESVAAHGQVVMDVWRRLLAPAKRPPA